MTLDTPTYSSGFHHPSSHGSLSSSPTSWYETQTVEKFQCVASSMVVSGPSTPGTLSSFWTSLSYFDKVAEQVTVLLDLLPLEDFLNCVPYQYLYTCHIYFSTTNSLRISLLVTSSLSINYCYYWVFLDYSRHRNPYLFFPFLSFP